MPEPTPAQVVDVFKGLELSFTIPSKDIEVGRKLGEGGFGIVKESKWLGHIPVAIKSLKEQHLTREIAEEFSREAKLMAGIRSPNTIQFFGVCIDTFPYSIVMEYMENGSLYNVLSKNGRMDWAMSQRVAAEIAQGILFLHSHNMLHCDLKSENVLLDGAMHAKLTDFGLVKVRTNIEVSTGSTRLGGTPLWMAPEVLDLYLKMPVLAFLQALLGSAYANNIPSPFGIRTDVYSYGVIVWEIVSGKRSYVEIIEEIAREMKITEFNPSNENKIYGRLFEDIIKGRRNKIPDDCPPVLRNVVIRCWDGVAGNRPSVNSVLTHLKSNTEMELLPPAASSSNSKSF